MKYVSIDIETTGLDKDRNQILEIGAIIEDSNNPLPFDEIPKFKCIIGWEEILGSVFAVNLNARIIKILATLSSIKNEKEKEEFRKLHNIIHPADVVSQLYYFLFLNGLGDATVNDLMANSGGYGQIWNGEMVPMINNATKPITVFAAGKNFAKFDSQFLDKLPQFSTLIKFHHRVIDPATLYLDWMTDTEVPSLETCKKRAGLIDTAVSHDALYDAWDVIQVLRVKYRKESSSFLG